MFNYLLINIFYYFLKQTEKMSLAANSEVCPKLLDNIERFTNSFLFNLANLKTPIVRHFATQVKFSKTVVFERFIW